MRSHQCQNNSLSSHLIQLQKKRLRLTPPQILTVKLTLWLKMTPLHRLRIISITTTWIICQITSIRWTLMRNMIWEVMTCMQTYTIKFRCLNQLRQPSLQIIYRTSIRSLTRTHRRSRKTLKVTAWMSWDHCMRLLPMLKTKSLLTKSLRVPKRPRILIMKSLKVYTEVDKLQTMTSKPLMISWKETWSLTLMESLLNKNWQKQLILWNQKTFCCLENSILRRLETSRMNNSQP